MRAENVHEIVQNLIDAVVAAGDQPSKVSRIVISDAEMDFIQDSKVFSTTVSHYYGGSDTLMLENIVADKYGRYISFYLNGILVVREVAP